MSQSFQTPVSTPPPPNLPKEKKKPVLIHCLSVRVKEQMETLAAVTRLGSVGVGSPNPVVLLMRRAMLLQASPKPGASLMSTLPSRMPDVCVLGFHRTFGSLMGMSPPQEAFLGSQWVLVSQKPVLFQLPLLQAHTCTAHTCVALQLQAQSRSQELGENTLNN